MTGPESSFPGDLCPFEHAGRFPPEEGHGRRQRTTVANGRGDREGRAETTLERPALGHGHLRFSASPSPRRPQRRTTGQGGGQGPGMSGKFLRRNKEDLNEDQPTLTMPS